jgi:galactokinase/mevalonate kinase-like predicted kinase
MKNLFIPCRINFFGGWSDQLQWKYPAVVVNASIGWQHDKEFSPYPLMLDERGFRSAVQGVGTGLGISSIRPAAQTIYDADCFLPSNAYIFEALEAERKEGTKGGWQDQIGAIEPGLKCISTSDHETFHIKTIEVPGLFDNLVLFDSGIRRPARAIGEKVRGLFGKKEFDATLKENVKDARHAFQYDYERFAKQAAEGFNRLCEFVPEMRVKLPLLTGSYGSMMLGAGGGGFGVVFLTSADNYCRTAAALEAAGMTAYRPLLLDGVKVCE